MGEKFQKEMEERAAKAKAEAEKLQKAMEERAAKAKAEAEKAAAAAAAAAAGEEAPKEEEKEEEKKEEGDVKMEEVKKEEVDAEMEELRKPVEVAMDPQYLSLNDEEKKRKFLQKQQVDCLSGDMLNFSEFALPEKAEGFDEVNFIWSAKTAASKRLKEWIKERKITERIEELEPSEWFKDKNKAWATVRNGLQEKVEQFKRKKAADQRKKDFEEAKKKEEERKAAEEAKEAKRKEEEEKKAEEEKKKKEEEAPKEEEK